MIDTAKEIEVGVGYDWSPAELKEDEIQIPAQLAKYLNLAINDTVQLSFGFGTINSKL